MESLLLNAPYQTPVASPRSLLMRLLAYGSGEIASLVPGEESMSTQLRRISQAPLIFVDQSFLNALRGFQPIHSYQLLRPPAPSLCADIWEAVLKHPAPRVLGLTYNDLHWLNVQHPGNPSFCSSDLKTFAGHFQALLWPFEQWGEVASGKLRLIEEPWLSISGQPRDNWQALASTIPARFDGTWSVDSAEFRRAGARPVWDASVVGSFYGTREAAYHSAVAAGVGLAPYRKLVTLSRRITRVRRMILRGMPQLDPVLYRGTMDYVVSRSAVNFVCGSGIRYFVRKYLEMSAVGACMVTWPAGGLEHYGFRDGEHLELCQDPSDFGAVARRLRARPQRSLAMGRAVQALVHSRHTTDVRATQLLAWLRKLAGGWVGSGRFHEGEFQFTTAA